ncbi:MAG: hypothetical protein HQM10_04835 [Candidatus Riflebacteria bacterium]|nr:hypothetical protein [Candidatus Riflebacteria bacterium]
MIFQVSYPQSLLIKKRPQSNDFEAFFQTLFKCIKERGHILKIAVDSLAPTASPGVISILIHSTGKQINTWYIKRGYLRKQFYLDSMGYSGWSELARSRDLFEESQLEDEQSSRLFVENYRNNNLEKNISKWPQPEKHFEPGERSYYFLPLQIFEDFVIQLSRIDYFSFVKAVARAVRESDSDLIIKRHPLCKSKEVFTLLSELSLQPEIKISNRSVCSLIKNSKGVICINSGVGFESLFYYKPVINAGDSDYGWVTSQVQTLEEVYSFQTIARKPVNSSSIAKFLNYTCNKYFVNYDDESMMHSRLERIEKMAIV